MKTSVSNKLNLYWRAYFIVLLALFAYGLTAQALNTANLVYTIFASIGLVGFAGFVFHIAIGQAIIWKLYFSLVLLAMGMAVPWAIYGFLFGHFPYAPLYFALTIAIQVPQWYGLWRYIYRSPDLWAEPDDRPPSKDQ